jgi:diguanylate cyclase (GGDEF)-like protein/PAS domain S-box-containing protein
MAPDDRHLPPDRQRQAASTAGESDLYRLIAQNSTDMVSLHGPSGEWLYVSPACERVLGYRPDELIGKNGFPYIHPDDMPAIVNLAERLFREGGVQDLVARAIRKDNRVIWTDTTVRLITDEQGHPIEVQATTRDITERVEAEAESKRSEILHRMLVDNLPDVTVVVLDQDLRIVVTGGAGMRALPWWEENGFIGWKVPELRGRIDDDLLDLALSVYRDALKGKPGEFEFENGGVQVTVKALPLREPDGTVERALVVARDVTSHHSHAAMLEQSAERQRIAAQLGQKALRERDLEGLMQGAARSLTEALNIEHAAVLEHSEDPPQFIVRAGPESKIGSTFVSDGQATFTMQTQKPVVVEDMARETRFRESSMAQELGIRSGISVAIEGRDRPFGVVAAHSTEPRTYTDEEISFLVTVANVLSAAVERGRDEDASRHAALHDPLTGLANRTLALDRLGYALERRRREGGEVAVLVVDLDHFKLINDSLGHAAGDELLKLVAPRLRAAVRAGDTVARLGGDEFAVISPGMERVRDVITIAQKLAGAVSRPFQLESGERFISASIGIAVATQAADDAESLIRDADIAMYRAKGRGRSRYEVFDQEMRSTVLSRLRTETELRRALRDEELRVFYQPIVDLGTRALISLEALVRWEHPKLGLRGPDTFISVAEETGMISALGSWVLRRACTDVAGWQQRYGPLGLSVNVSARQLGDPLFAASAGEIVRECGLIAGSLGLEVTESTLIHEARSPRDTLKALGEHGMHLWLDDFGTGYSSLGYLKRFDLDGLKIDRSFVGGLGEDGDDGAIVEAIVRMAQALDLAVVAEGVETQVQVDALRVLGCESAQGYLYAKPAPPDEIERFIEASSIAGVEK